MLAERLGWTATKVRPFEPATLERDAAIRSVLGPCASDAYRGNALAMALLDEAAAMSTHTVFDRYVESARMWWSVKQVPPLDESVLSRLPQPLLVIFLDVPIEVGLSRRRGTSEYNSAEERWFLEQCSSYLRRRAAGNDLWVVIDSTQDLPTVLDQAQGHARDALRGVTESEKDR
jgi:thymidylate kinase